MFSTSVARSALLRRTAAAPLTRTRIAPARRAAGRRFQSTTNRAPDVTQSPLIAGLSGGLAAFVGGYIWYHASGTAKTLDTLRSAIETVEKAKETVKQNIPEPPAPKQALKFIRSTATSYAALLPGDTKDKMDSAFNKLEDLASGPKAEEVQKLVTETYNELKRLFSEGGFDSHTAERVKEILEDKGKRLRRLTGDVGQQLLDKTPGLQDALKKSGAGDALSDIADIAKEAGPEATKTLQGMYKDLEQLLNGTSLAGAATDPNKIYKAVNIIREKSDEIRRLGQKAAERAWDEAYGDLADNKDGLLNMVPEDIKRFLDENVDSLKKVALSGGGIGGVYEVVGIIRRYAQEGQGSEGAEKLRKYVEDKLKETKSTAKAFTGGAGQNWENIMNQVEDYVKQLPGGDKLLESTPKAKDLMELFKQKSPQAKKLAEETVQEVSEVLNRRLEQARKLAKDTKKEGYDRARQ